MDAEVPFPAADELIGKLIDHVIPDSTAKRLGDELSCVVLDDLYPILDFVARKSSLHIDPIHKHLQKGRKIVLTEDPSLHLVWNYDIVYIKPLPHYLLSHSFWSQNLGPRSQHRGNALGFVRSYERLIRYPSDFELAREAQLLPSSSSSPSCPGQPQQQSVEELTYAGFMAFIQHFSGIGDAKVSRRWHFGQIRLSRLNWAVRIFQPKVAREKGFLHRLFYEEQFWQTGQFVDEFAAPLLYVFAMLSLILSAMQVVLAAKSGDDGSWQIFGQVSVWFAVVVIIVLIAVFFGLGGITVGVWLWQLQFGYRSWKSSHAVIGAAGTEAGIEAGIGAGGVTAGDRGGEKISATPISPFTV